MQMIWLLYRTLSIFRLCKLSIAALCGPSATLFTLYCTQGVVMLVLLLSLCAFPLWIWLLLESWRLCYQQSMCSRTRWLWIHMWWEYKIDRPIMLLLPRYYIAQRQCHLLFLLLLCRSIPSVISVSPLPNSYLIPLIICLQVFGAPIASLMFWSAMQLYLPVRMEVLVLNCLAALTVPVQLASLVVLVAR